MADDRKFPPRSLWEISYEKQSYKNKPDDQEFVLSIRKELIAAIIAIKCSGDCNKNLMDQCTEKPPTTGYCGHLFCTDCAKFRFDDFRESVKGEVRRLNEDGPKYIPIAANYEANCSAEGGLNKVLYACNRCEKKKGNPNIERGHEEYLKLFSVNIMLQNLYTALKEPGFCCGSCKKYHPKYNSLNCITCGSEKGEPFRYTCVWDSHRHKTHTEEEHDLRIMIGANDNPLYPASKSESNHRLASLDRSQRIAFAPLYHCALCSCYLTDHEHASEVHSHLECGHFVGSGCVTICKNQSEFHCIFCNKPYNHKNIGAQYFIFPSNQLAGLVQNSPHQAMYCSGQCDSLNPDPAGEGTCKWCTVEDQLKRREEQDRVRKAKEPQEMLKNMGLDLSGKK